MSLSIGRFTPYQALAASPLAGVGAGSAAAASGRGTAGAAGADTLTDAIPPAPTQEARELVDRAAQVVDDLYKSNRQLSFSIDKSTNRVVIEVQDLDGNVIKTIPPAKALDVMSGAQEL
jgi:flagellar protein FlaG